MAAGKAVGEMAGGERPDQQDEARLVLSSGLDRRAEAAGLVYDNLDVIEQRFAAAGMELGGTGD